MQKNSEGCDKEEEFECCRTFRRAYEKLRHLILAFITFNIFLNRSLTERNSWIAKAIFRHAKFATMQHTC